MLTVDKKDRHKHIGRIMYLITMAHLGEAQSFIKNYHLKKQNHHCLDKFYSNCFIDPISYLSFHSVKEQNSSSSHFPEEIIFLLITGEGPVEASTKTAFALSWIHHNFSHQQEKLKVINTGIAGSLNSTHKVGNSYFVRSFYLTHQLLPFYQSFQTASLDLINNEIKDDYKYLDCMTSFERILDKEKATPLKGIAGLVDREGWGVAFASKQAGVPFYALKIVSDLAGTEGACEIVKDKKDEFSELICDSLTQSFFKSFHKTSEQEIKNEMLSNSKEELFESFLPSDLHFTHSTKHQFYHLIKKISLKESSTIPEVLAMTQSSMKEILNKEMLPKEKTKIVLQYLQKKLNPIKQHIDESLQKLSSQFAKHDFRLSFDPSLEKEKVQIVFEAKDDQELKQKIESLEILTLKPFSDIMNGQFQNIDLNNTEKLKK